MPPQATRAATSKEATMHTTSLPEPSAANDNRESLDPQPPANDTAPPLTYQVDRWGCVRVLRRPRRQSDPSSC